MSARSVSLVTYRAKSGFDVVGMCSCVCVSDWFREQGVKNCRTYLAAICYVSSVCTTLL